MKWDDPEANKQLLEALSIDRRWSSRFPEYISYLSSMSAGPGRKNQALHKVVRVQRLAQAPLDERLELVHGICASLVELGADVRGHPRLGIPADLQPICDRTLDEALGALPGDFRAHIWTAAIASDCDDRASQVNAALMLAPESQLVASIGARLSLDWAAYAVHEVPAGLLAEPSDIEADLDRAEVCATRLSPLEASRVRETVRYYREKLRSFLDGRRHAL
jgi:hypothetical protein